MSSFFQRLRERKLFQWSLAYLAGAWLVFQGIEVVAEPWHLSETLQRTLHILIVIGLLPTLVLAWYHGEKGRQTVSGVELLILASILVGAGVVVVAVGGKPDRGTAVDRAQPVTSTARRKSVAVLPFINLSGSSEDEIVSDGVTFEIINHLSKIADLRVISRTSIMRYKNVQQNLGRIAKELGVATVLEGQVQRAGDRIRVSAQLIDAQTDKTLWADQYDQTFDDVFAIQSEVARQIALALQATMTHEEGERIAQVPTQDLEAYNSYLLGRHWWNKRTAEGLETAILYFEDSIRRDSTFVLAYVGLAESYALLPWYSERTPGSVRPKAMAAAQRAVELDAGSGEAHATLAIVKLWYEWDWRGAETEFKNAIELSPNYATAHQWYASLLALTGRMDKAIARQRIALTLDPLSAIIGANLGDELYYARRYDEAIRQYLKTLDLYPDFWYARRGLGLVYLQKRMYEEAESEMRRVNIRHPALAYAYSAQGRIDEALAVLEAAEAGSLESRLYAYVGIGEIDRAFEILDEAYELRALWLLEYPFLDPYFEVLRSDPRFTTLTRRIGLGP
jgi:TolB-like protein/Flp pilus assembly protein TadD